MSTPTDGSNRYATFGLEPETAEKGGRLGARKAVGLAALLVGSLAIVAIGNSGPSDQGAASIADLIKDDQHDCPLWPNFCKDRQACLDRYYEGDATAVVSPLLGDAYTADCNLYCVECDCPGSEYCQQLGESIKEGEANAMTFDTSTWVQHGSNETDPSLAARGVCSWNGASVYSQPNEMYPACPDGTVLFGMDQGGFCCKNNGGDGGAEVPGACAPGMEDAPQYSATICAVQSNQFTQGYDVCAYDGVDIGSACTMVYGLGSWTNVDFQMFFTFTGDVDGDSAAGPFINMVDPEDTHSPRYWLKFGKNFGLYKYVNSELQRIAAAGPPPIALWTFDADMTDSIGDMDMAIVEDGGGTYVDTEEGALVLDGATILHSNGGTADLFKGPVALGVKTITSWVSLATLDQVAGGGPISVESGSTHSFDAIVFEELQDDTWTQGSSYSDRRMASPGHPRDYEANRLHHIAIVYGGDGDPNQIELFHDGESQGLSSVGSLVVRAADDWGVVMGTRAYRHSTSNAAMFYTCAIGCMEGKIYEAAVYDKALTADQIAMIYGAHALEGTFVPGQTYEVRLKSEMDAEHWSATDTGGMCSFFGGEWIKPDGTAAVLKQDGCTGEVVSGGASTAITVLGGVITMGAVTSTGLVGSTMAWSDGTSWTLANGSSQRIRAWVDGQLVADVNDNEIRSGAVGFATYHASMQAFGLKVHDDLGTPIYETLKGFIQGTGETNIYLDGQAVTLGVEAGHNQDIRVPNAYTVLAVSSEIEVFEDGDPFTLDGLTAAANVVQTAHVVNGPVNGGGKGLCEADCDNNNECAGSLICWQRDGSAGENPAPGCPSTGMANNWDYCYDNSNGAATPVIHTSWSVGDVEFKDRSTGDCNTVVCPINRDNDPEWGEDRWDFWLRTSVNYRDSSYSITWNGAVPVEVMAVCNMGGNEPCPGNVEDYGWIENTCATYPRVKMGVSQNLLYSYTKCYSQIIVEATAYWPAKGDWASKTEFYVRQSDFVVGESAQTHEEADEWCRKRGRRLATIYSDAQWEYIKDLGPADASTSKRWYGFSHDNGSGPVNYDESYGPSSWYPSAGWTSCNTDVWMQHRRLDADTDQLCYAQDTDTAIAVCGNKIDSVMNEDPAIAVALSTANPDTMNGASDMSIATKTDRQWTDCAVEGAACECAAGNVVRYGTDSTFYEIVSPAAGSVACGIPTFGDPAVGVAKACKCGVRIDNKYWRCSATAPADADGTQWYQVGYQGKSTWADAEVIQAAQQQGTPPGGSEFVGVATQYTENALSTSSCPGWDCSVLGQHCSDGGYTCCTANSANGSCTDGSCWHQDNSLPATGCSSSLDAPQGTGKTFCVYDKPAAVAPAAGELIAYGGFEYPAATSWQTTHSYDPLDEMPPGGWKITEGSMDWGEFVADGHCTSTCGAHGTSQALDMCGGGQGTIEQTVEGTAAGSVYELSYAINAHASCGGSTKTMNVYVNDVLLVTETKSRCGDWSAFAGCWTNRMHDVSATGETTKLTFKALDDSCGCMVLDEVSFQLKPAAAAR